jgi:hypothetical protein
MPREFTRLPACMCKWHVRTQMDLTRANHAQGS